MRMSLIGTAGRGIAAPRHLAGRQGNPAWNIRAASSSCSAPPPSTRPATWRANACTRSSARSNRTAITSSVRGATTMPKSWSRPMPRSAAWSSTGARRGCEGKSAQLINLMRKRGLDVPIVLLVRRKRFEDIPVEVLDFIDGYRLPGRGDAGLHRQEPGLPAASNMPRRLKTPFFGALVDYAEEGNQLWTCPGHNGGIFYRRSPIGRIFVEHLGEAVFRDDLDNSVLRTRRPADA